MPQLAQSAVSARSAFNDGPLDPQLRRTYLWLRVAIAAVAFALPLLLSVGGHFTHIKLQASMSAYYYATHSCPSACPPSGTQNICSDPTGTFRNEFVGLLFAVGALLLVYKGYTRAEDNALNIAGVLAVGVALIPTHWTCGRGSIITPHGTCAVTFFLMLAFVSAFCSKATVPLLPPNKRKRYLVAYRSLAALMFLSPVIAYGINRLGKGQNFIFFAEAAGVYSFAAYWVVKLFEIDSIGERTARAAAEPRNVVPFRQMIEPRIPMEH